MSARCKHETDDFRCTHAGHQRSPEGAALFGPHPACDLFDTPSCADQAAPSEVDVRAAKVWADLGKRLHGR